LYIQYKNGIFVCGVCDRSIDITIYNAYIKLYLYSVAPPNVTPLDNPSVSTQPFNKDFTVTYLIELNPAVDTPVEVKAEWLGPSLISNSSHVAATQPAAEPPYSTSLSFSPLQQSDMGTYLVTVNVFPTSEYDDLVKNSTEVHVSMRISVSKCITQIC